MKVLFINNHGGGFADHVDVSQGVTVDQFFKERMPGQSAEDFVIRVNRQPVPRECVLQEGDRITMTPTKVEGAAK